MTEISITTMVNILLRDDAPNDVIIDAIYEYEFRHTTKTVEQWTKTHSHIIKKLDD